MCGAARRPPLEKISSRDKVPTLFAMHHAPAPSRIRPNCAPSEGQMFPRYAGIARPAQRGPKLLGKCNRGKGKVRPNRVATGSALAFLVHSDLGFPPRFKKRRNRFLRCAKACHLFTAVGGAGTAQQTGGEGEWTYIFFYDPRGGSLSL